MEFLCWVTFFGLTCKWSRLEHVICDILNWVVFWLRIDFWWQCTFERIVSLSKTSARFWSLLTAFLVVVKDQQRVTSKVRISYVTQRNNTFLFLFDLFSEFTSELRLFFKLVTLISFFCCFIFRVYEAVQERKHGYLQWKFVSKPIIL